jgi:hypothetical protein
MKTSSVIVSSSVEKKVKSASKKLGFEEKDLVDRALLLYLDSIEKNIQLKKEFAEWDALSDEVMEKF